MSENTHLSAETRTSFGKGAARKLRALNKIPAVIYGHGTEPRHVALPGHETALLLRKANLVLTLDIDGDEQLALVKDVQKDPVRQLIEHIDLIVVRKGEKVVVDVPVHVEGESFAGTVAMLDATTLSVEAEATHIPESFTVSVEGLEEGTQILAGQVELPKGTTLITDPETLVVNITVPQLDLTSDAEGDETAEGAEGETAEGDESADADEAAGDDSTSE
ncbi:50S ribosomal protein L25/general stress protein Ctc [Microcella daejeonensis]|uniref:50S ribosomal protein L25/general stress protein Ctc n=1 Tax=Microcella daejeonensis TaxID=2994971 RepID=UPI00227125ED|nr:50S ribosomal protein L25/general stress protein Ctc [Microcella daejeonensis]WAB85145.1 50S ribosomal protein L25/general stress protein Ctc [Microcella daejeonensis]